MNEVNAQGKHCGGSSVLIALLYTTTSFEQNAPLKLCTDFNVGIFSSAPMMPRIIYFALVFSPFFDAEMNQITRLVYIAKTIPPVLRLAPGRNHLACAVESKLD